MLLLSLFAVLLQITSPPLPHRVELVPHFAKVTPSRVTLPRDERLDLMVSLTAPRVESDVEDLEIKAENQQEGYWTGRQGPNLFVKIERVEPGGKRHIARTRIFSSGSGKSLNEHYHRIDIEFLDSPEARRDRIRKFFEETSPTRDPTRSSLDGAVAYFERLYIANPPGKYEITIEYRPKTGMFAGRSLGRRLTVVVPDGPDSIDRIAKQAVSHRGVVP